MTDPKRFLLLALVVAGLGSAAFAQPLQLVVPGIPVAPGSAVQVSLLNTTPTPITYLPGCEIMVLRKGGERTSIGSIGGLGCDVLLSVQPGATAFSSFLAPVENGSYLVVFTGVGTAPLRVVARLDVGAPDPDFPSLIAFPSASTFASGTHLADFNDPSTSPWDLANTGPAAVTLGTTAGLLVFEPGGAAPVAGLPLSGVSISAGGTTRVTLPIQGLPSRHYTAEFIWFDASLGGFRSIRHGIRPPAAREVDLHVTGGHEVELGGQTSLGFALTGFTPTVPHSYALLLGLLPGRTPLPGGGSLPLVLDGLVMLTLTGDLGGLLVGHVGVIPPAPLLPGGPVVQGILLSHPGVVLGDLRVRAAAVVVDGNGANLQGSQPEELILQ